VNRSFFFSLALCRTRSRPAVTLSRLGVRSMLGSNTFPSAPSLGSTGSAADCSALFPASSLLWKGLTSRDRASSATALAFPLRTGAVASGQSRDLPVPAQGTSRHAGIFDRAGSMLSSRLRQTSYCLPHSEQRRHPECHFVARYPACRIPCQRFAAAVTDGNSRMTRAPVWFATPSLRGTPPAIPCRSPGALRVETYGAVGY